MPRADYSLVPARGRLPSRRVLDAQFRAATIGLGTAIGLLADAAIQQKVVVYRATIAPTLTPKERALRVSVSF